MRLIDADAFDKCLERAEIEAMKNQKYVFNSAINTIRGNLANFPTVNRWVSCSERLPDLDKYVLCTVNDQGEGNEVAMMCLTTSIRADDYYYWTDYACEYTWELCEVFAWMPLPDPWEGGEE